MWYTPEYSNPEREWGEMKGLPLEMTLYRDGLQMKLTASHIQEEKVEASMFTVPEGYEVITADELMEIFGQ